MFESLPWNQTAVKSKKCGRPRHPWRMSLNAAWRYALLALILPQSQGVGIMNFIFFSLLRCKIHRCEGRRGFPELM